MIVYENMRASNLSQPFARSRRVAVDASSNEETKISETKLISGMKQLRSSFSRRIGGLQKAISSISSSSASLKNSSKASSRSGEYSGSQRSLCPRSEEYSVSLRSLVKEIQSMPSLSTINANSCVSSEYALTSESFSTSQQGLQGHLKEDDESVHTAPVEKSPSIGSVLEELSPVFVPKAEKRTSEERWKTGCTVMDIPPCKVAEIHAEER